MPTSAHPRRYLIDTFTLARLVKRDHREVCRLVARLTSDLPSLRPEFSIAWVKHNRLELGLHASARAFGLSVKGLVLVMSSFTGPVALARLSAVLDKQDFLHNAKDPVAHLETMFTAIERMGEEGLFESATLPSETSFC